MENEKDFVKILCILTACYYHVTYELQSESTLYSSVSLAKWLCVCLQTKWLWVQIDIVHNVDSEIPS